MRSSSGVSLEGETEGGKRETESSRKERKSKIKGLKDWRKDKIILRFCWRLSLRLEVYEVGNLWRMKSSFHPPFFFLPSILPSSSFLPAVILLPFLPPCPPPSSALLRLPFFHTPSVLSVILSVYSQYPHALRMLSVILSVCSQHLLSMLAASSHS